MKKYYALLTLAFLFSIVSMAQISHGGQPYSFNHTDLKSSIDSRIIDKIDIDQLLVEDAFDENDPNIPWRFGKDIEVNFTLENTGTWEMLPNGDRLWRLEIISYEAFSLNLIYSKYEMPQGGKLFVYNEEKTHVVGSFTSENHKPNGGFATVPVKGERCILEYYEPAESLGEGQLEISYVVHAYKDFYSNYEKGFGSSGSCNVNVNCPEGEGWQTQKRGVAMILTGNNSRICTGSMINNTAEDGTPYFLTANHCLGVESNWIIMFNYESPECDNVDGPTDQSVQYATLRANNSTSDFALIELSEVPPIDYNVYYNGWNKLDEAANQSVCIHHPKGDIKKISFDDDPLLSDKYLGSSGIDDSHWRIVQWDLGTTEPGSSGSPLFNTSNKLIVGQLHGGYASCSSLTSDWYGKFSMSWDYSEQTNRRLMDWLDPLNLDPDYLNGFDPMTNDFALNATAAAIIEPVSNYDGPIEVSPIIVIRNMGNQALETLQVSYKIGDGDVYSQTWSGHLDMYDTAHVSFTPILLDYGVFELLAYVDSPNGETDEYPVNDTITKTIQVNYGYDISIVELISPNGVDCSGNELKTIFSVKNEGFNSIDGITAYVKFDDDIPLIYELSGTILSGSTRFFILDTITKDEDWHSISLTVEIDGQEDANIENNTIEAEFNAFGNTISLEIETDENGEETSWIIKTVDHEILYSGGDYNSNQSIKSTMCMASGCYYFTIYDTGGDGILNEEGFQLFNTSTSLELGSGTTFGDSLTIGFCIGSELTSQFSLANDTSCNNTDVFFINQCTAADYYSWFFEGGNPIASNEPSPIVQYKNAGVYDVSLTAWQGEESLITLKEDYITVVNCAGVEEIENSLFTIYPNPTKGIFTLQIQDDINFDELVLYNQMGAVVYTTQFDTSISKQIQVDLDNGLYFVELRSKEAIVRQMLLITK